LDKGSRPEASCDSATDPFLVQVCHLVDQFISQEVARERITAGKPALAAAIEQLAVRLKHPADPAAICSAVEACWCIFQRRSLGLTALPHGDPPPRE